MTEFSTVLLAAYALLLIVAALQDVRSLRISNIWPVAILVVGIAAVVVAPEAEWWQHAVTFLGVLAVAIPLFSKGWIGGGDAKLLAAAAAWFDFEGFLVFLPSVLVTGGLITILLVFLRMSLPATFLERSGWKSLKKRGPIPYGVPIAIGAIFSALSV